MNKKVVAGVTGLVGAAALSAGIYFKTVYLVVSVKDGDSFEVADRGSVRFDTLDAPELTNCGGEQAKKELEKIIMGKKVTLNVATNDSYGRKVASVWSGRTWIDQKLMETGWVAYSSSEWDPKHILHNIDLKNRETKIGIYSELCTQYENKDQPKCVIKGNISGEWLKKGEKAYHFPGCIQYNPTRIEKWRGEQWFCTEKEAIAAGYTKSGGCGVKSWK
ncbi:MAG: thermonuclease family protein [Candidatus Amesbacteria bacterium]|nr:thermonuclease family protein [Candidatus Amesbacteria bacterium]